MVLLFKGHQIIYVVMNAPNDNNKSMHTWLNNHKIKLKELTDKPYKTKKVEDNKTDKPYKTKEVEDNKSDKQNNKENRQHELLLKNISTLELIKEEIEKYDTLTDFITNNPTMRGWLTRHKIKLRDISDKPYKERKGPSKPVHQFTLSGEYVRSYNNARETEGYGFNFKNVSQVCNGKRKSHKGYVFRFEK